MIRMRMLTAQIIIKCLVKVFVVLTLSVSVIDLYAANIGEKVKTLSFHDSIVVKTSVTRIYGRIKLHSNSSCEALLFTATGIERKVYQLFLFDMGGRLVSQTRIRNSETALLSKFEKGNYMFEIFNNDDKIEYGSIVVK